MLGDKTKKRERKMIHPHGEREQTPHRERIVSSPPRKNRREEQERERHRSPVSQHMMVSNSQIPVTLSTSVCDAMSKNLQRISQSPFFFWILRKLTYLVGLQGQPLPYMMARRTPWNVSFIIIKAWPYTLRTKL